MDLFLLKTLITLMSQIFTLYTYTPWDGLKTNELSQVRLLSLKSILKSFPVIEKDFFDDLKSRINDNLHYSITPSIRRIVGPNNEDYDISSFNFIWALDDQNRMYQFLFQNIKKKDNLQSILVALAPPELGKLFSEYKEEVIHRIFSLLNKPSKIKFLMILIHKGKSLAQEPQTLQYYNKNREKFKFLNNLGNMPNIRGEWFPAYQPRCPVCNTYMKDLDGYKVGLGKLICPKCGFEKV